MEVNNKKEITFKIMEDEIISLYKKKSYPENGLSIVQIKEEGNLTVKGNVKDQIRKYMTSTNKFEVIKKGSSHFFILKKKFKVEIPKEKDVEEEFQEEKPKIVRVPVMLESLIERDKIRKKSLETWIFDNSNDVYDANSRYCFYCKEILSNPKLMCFHIDCRFGFHQKCCKDYQPNLKYFCERHYCSVCKKLLEKPCYSCKICWTSYCEEHVKSFCEFCKK